MSELQNQRLLKALLREPVDRTPVWVRCHIDGSLESAEQVCAAMVQQLEQYPLDAVALCSDALTIPKAMGFDSTRLVRVSADIARLNKINAATDFEPLMQAVRLARQKLDGRVPLIGFASSPWTLATHMVEGSASSDFRSIKTMLYNDSDALHELLDLLADAVIDVLNEQIKAGVQAVQINDSLGGVLSDSAFLDFSLKYTRKVVQGLIRESEGRKVPVTLFVRGSSQCLEQMAAIGVDALGLDWTTGLSQARSRVGASVALQGNMDPSVLYAHPSIIRREVKRILESYGLGTGHVFSLGAELPLGVDPEHVRAFVEAVVEYSPAYH